MSFFNFNPFSKKTSGSNDEPKEQTSKRCKEITDSFARFIRTEHPDIADDPMTFLVAGCYYSVGASGVDKFRKTMPLKDAVTKAIEQAQMQIQEVDDKVAQSCGSSVERSLISLMHVCFASIGAKWAAENPEK